MPKIKDLVGRHFGRLKAIDFEGPGRGVKYTTLYARVARGWLVEKAITTPVKRV